MFITIVFSTQYRNYKYTYILFKYAYYFLVNVSVIKQTCLEKDIENLNIYDGHTNNQIPCPKTTEPKLLFLILKTLSFFNVFIINQCFLST